MLIVGLAMGGVERRDMPFCPNCGREVVEDARFCANCGYDLSRGVPRASAGPSPPPPLQPQQTGYGFQVYGKDPTIAILLALIAGFFGLFGIGHIYVGQTMKGIMLLVVGIVLAVLVFVGTIYIFCGIPFLIIGFVLWIYQALDAHKLAIQYNETLQQTGGPPW